MTTDATLATATTTAAVAADSQTRDYGSRASFTPDDPAFEGMGTDFTLGQGVRRKLVEPYRRLPGDPLYRPLRIYTVDPSASRLEGAIGTINVPYEPLEPGPVGCLFSVDNRNEELEVACPKADLNDPHVLMTDGYQPSPSNPRFHQQMVYAVCSNVYSAFKTALGCNLSWGFGSETSPGKLVLKPHAGKMRNAFYSSDAESASIRFGYYPADAHPTDGSKPKGLVFTCPSHDIVAHEVTHALLDGLRAHFSIPSGPDVPAFHEAFADLVAVFQHFSYREVVMAAIQRSRGSLEKANLLRSLAQQFGHTTGHHGPLRYAIEADTDQPKQYSPSQDAHELGSILVSAVFEAFVTVFRRKVLPYIRLATNGSGLLPAGDLSHDLQIILSQKASKLASQFLAICIRAIDYCPPVGLNFGDYLRALITADYDVVPDDLWDYRGALIVAFRRRKIYPRDVANLSEDALLWCPPRMALPPVTGLDFAELRFKGDPAQAADARELRRQACALGRYMTQQRYGEEFGLVHDGDPRLSGDNVDAPCVESIRTARRAGPDGQIVFDLVAEITQRRHVRSSSDGPGFAFYGGATVILGPNSNVRYVVLKNVANASRLERRRQFLQSSAGSKYWTVQGGRYVEKANMFSLAHE
jgi:hypothetical protein